MHVVCWSMMCQTKSKKSIQQKNIADFLKAKHINQRHFFMSHALKCHVNGQLSHQLTCYT